MILRLALASLRARALTVTLTLLSVALSVLLFLGVENIRTGARASFADTISGTDLIVGARSGAVPLLLYSVFRIGNATSDMSWQSYQQIAARPEVDWIVPMALGDSHRQFRVMGTTADFFTRYRYRGGRGLEFAAGSGLDDLYDTVIGAEVAQRLGYAPGDAIVVSHGLASFSHMTTSRSAWRGCWRAPARRWTAPSSSAFRGSRRFTSTGAAARAFPARPPRPRRSARWTSRPAPSPRPWSA